MVDEERGSIVYRAISVVGDSVESARMPLCIPYTSSSSPTPPLTHPIVSSNAITIAIAQ